MRRIIYNDPRDGTTYTYITNEMTMPAYQLVMIYKHRWDTEKVFYQFKSKMEGLKDEVEETKTKGREKSRKSRDGNPVGPHNNFIGKAIKRATHRTARLIRWIQSAL